MSITHEFEVQNLTLKAGIDEMEVKDFDKAVDSLNQRIVTFNRGLPLKFVSDNATRVVIFAALSLLTEKLTTSSANQHKVNFAESARQAKIQKLIDMCDKVISEGRSNEVN